MTLSALSLIFYVSDNHLHIEGTHLPESNRMMKLISPFPGGTIASNVKVKQRIPLQSLTTDFAFTLQLPSSTLAPPLTRFIPCEVFLNLPYDERPSTKGPSPKTPYDQQATPFQRYQAEILRDIYRSMGVRMEDFYKY